MSRRRHRPTIARFIWIARDSTGVFAYNHRPKSSAGTCDDCGQPVRDFAGRPEVDYWELCDEAAKVLRFPKLKHGEVVRYQLVPGGTA